MDVTITKQWLRKQGACTPAVEWFCEQSETDPVKLAKIAMSDGHFNWVNWALTRKMNRRQKVDYAIFAAELVIDIYAKKYPYDERPQRAIDAAREYLRCPSKKTKDAARVAAAAFVIATSAAAYAARAAADAAVYAAADAVKTKIIKYGIKLLT